MNSPPLVKPLPLLTVAIFLPFAAVAHEHTRPRALLAQAAPSTPRETSPTVPLRIEVTVGESAPVGALVRITSPSTGKLVSLPAHLGRPMGWYSLEAGAQISVPAGELKIEACHGLETEVASVTTHAREGAENRVRIALRRFYDARARRLAGGNTHLHLQYSNAPVAGAVLRNRPQAEEYLRNVADSDALDLVFVSHLVRTSEDARYVSNQFTRDDLLRWSNSRYIFVNGQEHRHEGGLASGRGGPQEVRYGHVLFLDLPQLVPPVSYGAIFDPAKKPSDAVPMRKAILAAREQQSTIIWCHGQQGQEDIPNWVDGVLHAQNIYDGGSEGTFETLFYTYLNAGMRVPFSTGTDWGTYDFSRVYVPIEGEITSRAFRDALAQGRSFITNGTLLEFDVEGQRPGDTVALASGRTVRLRGRAIGREDFAQVEIIFNGRVIARASSRRADQHFATELDTTFSVTEPGWFALRIPTALPYNDRTAYTGAGSNIFGKALFAHTSAVYVSVGGRSVGKTADMETLVRGIDASIATIEAKGAFASDAERDSLLAMYRSAANKLRERMR
jgi:hypothetical protein